MAFVSVYIDGNGWPARQPGQWCHVKIGFDAAARPQVTASLDGAPVPYEQGADGVWRVARAASELIAPERTRGRRRRRKHRRDPMR